MGSNFAGVAGGQSKKFSNLKLTTNAAISVVTEAPMNPSQVFLGESFINGVLPKKKPKIYAAISFTTIRAAGRRNLKQITLL